MPMRTRFLGLLLAALALCPLKTAQSMMVVNQTEDEVRQSTFSEKVGAKWTGALVTFQLSHYQDSPNGVARTYSAKVVTIHTPHADTTFADVFPEGAAFSFQGTPLSPFAGMIRTPGQTYLGFFKLQHGAAILMSMKAARVDTDTVVNVWKPQPVREKYMNLSGQTRYSVGPATPETLEGFVSRNNTGSAE